MEKNTACTNIIVLDILMDETHLRKALNINVFRIVLSLAVDDATTEVLAGWFMPTECTRGYARMLKLIIEKEGKPQALYSDKDSVFRSVKNGAPSQFGRICSLLHIEQIFANSPEGKGRIERYNETAQNRLPNDIIRFGIPHD